MTFTTSDFSQSPSIDIISLISQTLNEHEKILKALKEKYPVATKSGKIKFPDLNLNSWDI